MYAAVDLIRGGRSAGDVGHAPDQGARRRDRPWGRPGSRCRKWTCELAKVAAAVEHGWPRLPSRAAFRNTNIRDSFRSETANHEVVELPVDRVHVDPKHRIRFYDHRRKRV